VHQDLKNTFLEPVLAEHLRPVAAPAELWSRIHKKENPLRRVAGLRVGWVAVTATLLIAGASAIVRVVGADPGLSLESSSAPEIQAWVKKNTGMDLPLPAQLSDSVRLSAAHAGRNTAEVDYFVRNRPQHLQIARADLRASTEHRLVERTDKKISWTMGGQFYTVECASAEDAQMACMLCHS
jgi:hypothetical protein